MWSPSVSDEAVVLVGDIEAGIAPGQLICKRQVISQMLQG